MAALTRGGSAGEEADVDAVTLRRYEALGPFEIKNDLAAIATKASRAAQMAFLNAGRGNPNWVATEPRSGFFLLGQFAVTECTRTMDLPGGIGGMPKAPGIAARLAAWLSAHSDMPGATFLQHVIPWTIKKFEFDADAFVHELVDSIIGDNYPVPDRMLVHNELIVREYLQWAMCGEPRPDGNFSLYAVEGGTAAMCYLFKSFKANRLLNPGDTIALATPIFTPYLEMPHLEDYDLKMIFIQARQEQRWQFSDEDLAPLLDPAVKAFFVVNPGNPYAVAFSPETIARVGGILEKRPDLMLLTDDVYGTFVPGFRSLLGAFPRNTIGVYSYSKYFGCTGWRLGVIALHDQNVFDEKIASHTEAVKDALDRRYGGLTLEPGSLKFIDRIVADSRDVALNHTAGLSLPQQVMMALFSMAELYDDSKVYQRACIDIVRRRAMATIDGLGIQLNPNPLFDWYYGLIDFEFWLRKYGGEEVVQWVKGHVHPLDIVFRLAEDHGIVLLNGGGFEAPDWSVRVSFANLDDEVYENIGRAVRAVARGYVMAFEASGARASETPVTGGKAIR
jgi:aspartate 4-decarboxylase